MTSQKQQLIFVTDTKGQITYANDRYCEVTGYQRAELLTKNIRDLTHKDMPKAVISELSDTLSEI